MAKKMYSIRKYAGDDMYSWAVFRKDQNRPVVTGESRYNASSIRDRLQQEYEKSMEKGFKTFSICNLDQVFKFFYWLTAVQHLNWHVDTDFREYVHQSGERIFSVEEAQEYNRAMRNAHDVCDRYKLNIYEVGNVVKELVEKFQMTGELYAQA
jgi:hypothetical protein